MTIKTQLTQKDYIQLNYALLLQRVSTKILMVVAFLLLVSAIVSLVVDHKLFTMSEMFFPVFILIWFSLGTYLFAKRNYVSNKRLQEKIDYTINKEELSIKGESFTSELSWDKFYKIKKLKNWLLLYQSKQTANIIPRRDITDYQIEELKRILTSYNVSNNL